MFYKFICIILLALAAPAMAQTPAQQQTVVASNSSDALKARMNAELAECEASLDIAANQVAELEAR